MRLGHAGLGVIGNRERRNAAEVLERMHVSAQPRFHLLIARGLGPGVAAGAQRGHEQRRLPGNAGVPVIDRNRRACPIDEHLLARLVLLPQHHVELRPPTLVQLAEARVAIAIRVRLPVFFPQQLQSQMTVLPQLLMDRGEVRLASVPPLCSLTDDVARREQRALLTALHPSLPAAAK